MLTTREWLQFFDLLGKIVNAEGAWYEKAERSRHKLPSTAPRLRLTSF